MKMFIYLFAFLFLFKQIHNISGGDNEKYDASSYDSNLVDIDNICPCDLTADICDKECCCDPDCLPYLMYDNFFDSFGECKQTYNYNKQQDQKIEYCKGIEKSIDDLYNPLVIGFQILKKGFCLMIDNSGTDDNNYLSDKEKEKRIEEIEKKENELKNEEELMDDFNKTFPDNNNNLTNSSLSNAEEFKKIEGLNAAVSLPSGMCLFNAFAIRRNLNYEVTCSYLANEDNKNKIIAFANDIQINEYFIHDNYYYDNNTSGYNFTYPKKREIIYNNSNITVNIYYDEYNETPLYQDFTESIISRENEYDPYSGNPGYIKGKPIMVQSEHKNPVSNFYEILPLSTSSKNCSQKLSNTNVDFSYYYDNFRENVISFEDTLIYGCKKNTSISSNPAIFYIFDSKNYGIYGKTSFGDNGNNQHIKGNEKKEDLLFLIGAYKDVGAVNNTQFVIKNLAFDSDRSQKINGSYSYLYMKFFKYEKVGTKWWYAPGPGFIKLPKNIMYPFQIGTTTYAE